MVITAIAATGLTDIEASGFPTVLVTMAAIAIGIIHVDTTIPAVTEILGIITAIIAGMVDATTIPVVIAVTADNH